MSLLGLTEVHAERYQEDLDLIEQALSEFLTSSDPLTKHTADAMRYSTMIGGKRLRPVWVLEFCRMAGGNPEDAVPFACALEMIHTSSLIHDDLPSMDNDDFRRGKPSCHKEYGENYALLAGDALEAYAFDIASHADNDPATVVSCIRLLSRATGLSGMLGGQTMDEENETLEDISLERLTETDARKTGAFIRVACELGCAVAGAKDEQQQAAVAYGNAVGVAFQIRDDILDVIGDTEVLGKQVGSDAENHKKTYVSFLGLEEAEHRAELFTQDALNALDSFEDSSFLKELTLKLLERDY